MAKYVISGYIGFDNFGDEAIAGELVSYLKSKNAEKITVLSSNPQRTSELYGVDSVNRFKFILPILQSDVLISGGGSLLQDITSLKSLIYYLLVIFTGIITGKKVIIFAQGFTPFRTRIGKALTSFVLKKCGYISVRDSKSKNMLEDLKINAIEVSDPIFGCKIPQNPHKNGVGIQLRNFSGLNEKFMENFARKISESFAGKEIKLLSLQDSADVEVLQKFSEHLAKYGIKSEILSGLSTNEVIEEISKLEYLLAARFHALLVSVKSGTKTLGINYDKKVETLAKSTNFPLIEPESEDFSKEFETLLNLDPDEYSIPNFYFKTALGF